MSIFSRRASILLITTAVSAAIQAQPQQPAPKRIDERTLAMPPMPGELVTASATAATAPNDRAAAFALIDRAAQNAKMHLRTMSPYLLKVSFTAGGGVSQTGSGEMTEFWQNGQNWQWNATLGEFSIVQISQNGMIAGTHSAATVPSRIQSLRDLIFWAVRTPGPNAMVRTAAAQANGKPATCVLSSNMAPVNGPRLWEEEEYCIDNSSGMLVMWSAAPGAYASFGYSRNQQFHGRLIPDQITMSINGTIALDAQISVTDLGSADPALFTITPAMISSGPPPRLSLLGRMPMNVPDNSGSVRPVIVHAMIDGQGKVMEAELTSASDASLAQSAIAAVKGTNFGPSGMQRDSYINVRFGGAAR